jgi:hypothetical protein
MLMLNQVVVVHLGAGSDSGEGGSKASGSGEESAKQDAKNGKEPIHWHSRCVTLLSSLS